MYAYPGVYVEEIPSGARPIAGVSTSDAAFVDWFPRGPVGVAARITSWPEFERTFGGLDAKSASSWQIRQFFLNGGSRIWVVRIAVDAADDDAAGPNVAVALKSSAAEFKAQGNANALALTAASPGGWGDRLFAAVVHDNVAAGTIFDLTVREYDGDRIVAAEQFLSLSVADGHPRFAATLLNRDSRLVTATQVAGKRPQRSVTPADAADLEKSEMKQLTGGGDGAAPGGSQWKSGLEAAFTGTTEGRLGLEALNRIEPFVFNILCLPAAAELNDGAKSKAIYAAAYTLCEQRRAVLLVDAPEAQDARDKAVPWVVTSLGLGNKPNAATFFPRVVVSDPLAGGERSIGSSGTVAGVMARIDGARGVWKASAGVEAGLRNATPTQTLTDLQNGDLNIQGVNVLRSLPVYGSVVWGGRTLAGADAAASEWKYLGVRRLALFLEESLRQGLAWVVFEPNDEPLWGQIRLNVESFLQGLFVRGAFQGTSPRDAYYVLCDRSNNPQGDVNLGIVNIEIGFAPLRPAEFVALKFRQMAGQSTT